MKTLISKMLATPPFAGIRPFSGFQRVLGGLNAALTRATKAIKPWGLGGGRVAAANEAAETDETANAKLVTATLVSEGDGDEPLLTAVNATDGWINLLPYGDYPHPDVGVQVVDHESGELMSNALKGAFQKVKQFFAWAVGASAALPVYNGHPDDPHMAANGHTDMNVYGRVPEVEAREDGIWIKQLWNDSGRALLNSGKKLYYSPRWSMRWLSNGRAQPVRLISLGLTTNPNIPTAAAANAKKNIHTTPIMNPLLKALLAALGLTDEQANTAANAKADAVETSEALTKVKGVLTEAAKVPQLNTDLTTANNKVIALTGDLDTANKAKTKAEGELTTANTQLTNVSNAAANGLIDFAIEHGRIPAADKADWQKKFTANFVETANALKAIKPNTAIRTQSQTGKLGAQRGEEASNAGATLREERDRRVAASNGRLSQGQAWTAMKREEKWKPLFAVLGKK